jgi:hypothetical protein
MFLPLAIQPLKYRPNSKPRVDTPACRLRSAIFIGARAKHMQQYARLWLEVGYIGGTEGRCHNRLVSNAHHYNRRKR